MLQLFEALQEVGACYPLCTEQDRSPAANELPVFQILRIGLSTASSPSPLFPDPTTLKRPSKVM